jgi:ATP-dependent DNA ligase
MSKLILVTRNARDKVQVVITELIQIGNNFEIKRTTGQYQGKMTEQPLITIEKGKAKRSVLQQATLEYDSIVKKYLDKGYKRLDSLTKKKFEDLTSSEIDLLVASVKSDQNGNLKPMLAKSSKDCTLSVLERPLYCSKKLNGVRCMMKFKENGIITISRGGKNYNVPTKLIQEELYSFLESNPNYILDGELYIHGRYLQEISGMARLEKWEERCSNLEYWIYDICDDKLNFPERLEILKDMQELFEDSKHINVIDHVLTNSWNEIKLLHDKWVEEGYEGAVARHINKPYAFGKRSSTYMLKIKEYIDDEFKIIDYKDGLRPQDFTFILETVTGGIFGASPMGTVELRAKYLKDINNIIGKMATIRYFEISKDGLPLQTKLVDIRDYE